MTLRPILIIPNKILRTVAEPVGTIDKSIQIQIDDMFETMYDAPGIGLAAPQIGILNRVIVVDCAERAERENEDEHNADEEPSDQTADALQPEPAEEEPRPSEPIAMINPRIISFSDSFSIHEEGCLSIPDYYEEVERPDACRIRYLDREGATVDRDIDGLLSTCVQHEIDHLDGKLFIDYLSRLKRDRVLKKFQKAAKRSND